MAKQITLEFNSLTDLFVFREYMKTVTYKPGLKKLSITCDLINEQLAKAISLNAIPVFDEEDDGLMLSDYLCRSVFKNAYKASNIYLPK